MKHGSKCKYKWRKQFCHHLLSLLYRLDHVKFFCCTFEGMQWVNHVVQILVLLSAKTWLSLFMLIQKRKTEPLLVDDLVFTYLFSKSANKHIFELASGSRHRNMLQPPYIIPSLTQAPSVVMYERNKPAQISFPLKETSQRFEISGFRLDVAEFLVCLLCYAS
jgi:hypothetical protein